MKRGISLYEIARWQFANLNSSREPFSCMDFPRILIRLIMLVNKFAYKNVSAYKDWKTNCFRIIYERFVLSRLVFPNCFFCIRRTLKIVCVIFTNCSQWKWIDFFARFWFSFCPFILWIELLCKKTRSLCGNREFSVLKRSCSIPKCFHSLILLFSEYVLLNNIARRII